jgi:hypothetical protein
MNTTTTWRTEQASEKQYAFLSTLVAERDLTTLPVPVQDTAADVFNGEPITKDAASQAITALLAAPRLQVLGAAEVTEGMYWHDGNPVRVVRSESGRLYAKELLDGSFTYAPNLIRKIDAAARMTAEQAAAYGRATGRCACCGRELTDPASVARGVGPVCESRL